MAQGTYLYPLDHAPHEDSADAVAQREHVLQKKWNDYFAQLNLWIKDPKGKDFGDFIKKTSSRDLHTLVKDYGYESLRAPALQKAHTAFLREIALAKKTLDGKGILDIGDVANLNNAMREALVLHAEGKFTPDLSALLEEILNSHVEKKSIFWGFTKKFPYYHSGYNKECITMEVGSNTKLLYHGTGKFPHTIDAFDAAWSQLTQHAYELDNSPHYDSSVNLYIILRWGMLHGKMDEIKNAPHFRMFCDRMACMAMANGEHANFGKSMAVYREVTLNGRSYDDLFVNGGGLSTIMRWAYRFYRDPTYLYIARKYEMTNSSGKGVITFMPKAYDLNFFEVEQAMPRTNMAVNQCTLRLKGPGYSLDRGVRREHIQPVQDKLILSTGNHPHSASLLMDLSFTQSKAMANRRMGIDNHVFRGVHTVSIVGRPPEAERTNRIIITPADKKLLEKTTYVLRDCFATRVNQDLAYGEVSYSTFQISGVETKRRMALLHNGVLVVEDFIRASDALKEAVEVKTLYNVWTDTVARGENWVISTPHTGHLPDGKNPEPIQSLVYFSKSDEQKVEITEGKNHDTIQSVAKLGKGKSVRIISVVLPLPEKSATKHAELIGKGIVTHIDETGSTVAIPYDLDTQLVVRFPGNAGSCAEFSLQGKLTHVAQKIAPRQAQVNPPYSVAFGNKQEWYVPDFKADFSLHETRITAIHCQGKLLRAGSDYQLMGPILTLTKAFSDRLIGEKFRGDLTVSFHEGKPVILKLNADTKPCVILRNARREKAYINDEMMLAYGYRDNTKAIAAGGDYELTTYDDWLYRGSSKKIVIKSGQQVNLPKPAFKSFRIRRIVPP
ncbi:MAG: hypothetical protein RI957_371 [Verrucomicrobiota bacterium]